MFDERKDKSKSQGAARSDRLLYVFWRMNICATSRGYMIRFCAFAKQSTSFIQKVYERNEESLASVHEGIRGPRVASG